MYLLWFTVQYIFVVVKRLKHRISRNIIERGGKGKLAQQNNPLVNLSA